MLLQDAICTHRHTFVVECVAVSFTVNYLVLFLVSDNMIFKVLMQGAFSNSVFGYSWIAILCCCTYNGLSACLITIGRMTSRSNQKSKGQKYGLELVKVGLGSGIVLFGTGCTTVRLRQRRLRILEGTVWVVVK